MPPVSSATDGKYLCEVCFMEYPVGDTYAMHCEHRFCKVCFGMYIKSALDSGPDCISASCPKYKCKNIVPRSVFYDLLESQEDKDKYDKYLIQNFVDFDKSLKWCPSPNCDLCVHQPDQVAMDVFCDCGHGFCFKCETEAHVPLDCYY